MIALFSALEDGIAALALTLRSFSSFDAKVDRPRRGWDQPQVPPKETEVDWDEAAG